MKTILTKRQKEILDFIENFLHEHGYPPTLREIGSAFGIGSTNGVRVHLAALMKKNYIMRHRWLSRGIEIINIPQTQQTKSEVEYIPIIGKVAAGEQIFAAENIEGMLAIDDSLIKTTKLFALKVKDDSMVGAGIFNGDYVLARRQHNAEPGDIMVLIIGDEIMVKQYGTKGNKVLVIPSNEAYETRRIMKNSSDLQLVGKVVGLMRKY